MPDPCLSQIVINRAKHLANTALFFKHYREIQVIIYPSIVVLIFRLHDDELCRTMHTRLRRLF